MTLQTRSMIPQTTPVTLQIRLMILQMTQMIPQMNSGGLYADRLAI